MPQAIRAQSSFQSPSVTVPSNHPTTRALFSSMGFPVRGAVDSKGIFSHVLNEHALSPNVGGLGSPTVQTSCSTTLLLRLQARVVSGFSRESPLVAPLISPSHSKGVTAPGLSHVSYLIAPTTSRLPWLFLSHCHLLRLFVKFLA